ncbi:MAG: hypothetical protein A3I14_16360 [Candidatus Rokubacteria bacterium RIFCSPLOWO2_02_FULL_73_56]|nr:MAG: hypothetical protein A3D33_05180 [Candidatus Rokubacteria bacterium RIFCSPHIGHO2_02_FULL_73_26]OGL12552.1 MAG: hypothetical protein A3I14_16360 [Candidatus Rokubacteria bacterium RIFCSPLOWO2_02_FULL_73_56]OGL27089.1 MAG: hypothetical protein A3G44_02275 [Candidatus Rokubacteria bacterium RIFCSPLOWO2_12_FULL_73_47]
MSAIRAVLFDIGGVVQDSPLHAIARYERAHGLPANAINRAVAAAGETGAWARLERGELGLAGFYPRFEADCLAQGVRVDAARMMAEIAAVGVPRPQMLAAIHTLRERDLRVGALTNNWHADGPRLTDLHALFHVFIESRLVGLRKPDPRIYELACRELGVPPPATAFLDDIGKNLKSARALGMITIKVDDPDGALLELGALLGMDLLG